MFKIFRISSALLFITLLFLSCQPINYFTRLKKTPREYTVNYCNDNIKAPKSELDKQIWIVFSAQDDNYSYVNPGGKVKFKQFAFLDAFLVIKKKGEYLKLIKYNPEVINSIYNTKLKDKKKVEYCGWIHESKLILSRQTTTDVSTGFKNKELAIITDNTTLSDPRTYFQADSITTFKDENLIKPYGHIPLYSLIYVLKKSRNDENSLIAKKTLISPDSVKIDVSGWIPSSLIGKMGQRLHLDLETVPDSLILFKDQKKIDTLSVTKWNLSESQIASKSIKALKYNPVSFYKEKDPNSVAIRTAITTPIVNNENNYVFNVNGNKISYDKFQELEKSSKNINLLFVLEGHKKVIESYAEIANAIQNLQPLFEKDSSVYKYKFGTILTSQGKGSSSYPLVKASKLTNDYMQLMDSLVAEIDSSQFKTPIPNQYAWSGVEKAVSMLEPYKDENNIFVVIGGSGYSEWADSTLVRRIGNLNGRILGFQIHGVKDIEGNDFVLQIENMIERSARQISKAKKEKIVYASQVKPDNLFMETSKNVYKLDFPDYSMTQGWILFPEKEGSMPLDILTNSIDSLVMEIKWDNENVISSLYNAFNTVGKQRNLYASLFAEYNDIEDTKSLNRSFVERFSEQIPVGYLPSERINLVDSVNENVKYNLLLSKEEMDDLLLFVDKLSSIEVDIKYKGQKKTKKKDHCNCDDDDLDDIVTTNENNSESNSRIEYRSTKKLRARLREAYIRELTTGKLCKIPKRNIKNYTLGEAQRLITGCPSFTTILSKYRINDIKKKKKISDKDLDTLIEYFKLKKELLMKSLYSLDKFESNDQTYYWLDQRLLP